MTAKHLTLTIDNRGIARLTLSRQEVKNAFNEDLIGEIADAMGRLNAEKSVRVVVMTGAGDTFCAGADLSMMQRVAAYSAAENKQDARRLAHMLHAIYACEKPVIALVNGHCMGGGVGLASAADIVIASEEALFALSEVRLGLVPAVISPFVVRAIGVRQARRYFLTGERFDAATAREIGLAHMVAMKAQLEATLAGVIDNLLACGPNAQKEAKALIRLVAHRPIDEAVMEETAGLIARVRASEEGKEGVAAFLGKRKPNWIRD
jgi:methylglutaconyl-CoA hydratase